MCYWFSPHINHPSSCYRHGITKYIFDKAQTANERVLFVNKQRIWQHMKYKLNNIPFPNQSKANQIYNCFHGCASVTSVSHSFPLSHSYFCHDRMELMIFNLVCVRCCCRWGGYLLSLPVGAPSFHQTQYHSTQNYHVNEPIHPFSRLILALPFFIFCLFQLFDVYRILFSVHAPMVFVCVYNMTRLVCVNKPSVYRPRTRT